MGESGVSFQHSGWDGVPRLSAWTAEKKMGQRTAAADEEARRPRRAQRCGAADISPLPLLGLAPLTSFPPRQCTSLRARRLSLSLSLKKNQRGQGTEAMGRAGRATGPACEHVQTRAERTRAEVPRVRRVLLVPALGALGARAGTRPGTKLV